MNRFCWGPACRDLTPLPAGRLYCDACRVKRRREVVKASNARWRQRNRDQHRAAARR